MQPLTTEMKNFIEYGTEERRWEFKPPMAWTKGRVKKKFEITKAVLALSNISGGGNIIFGIFQKRDRSNGIEFEKRGLNTRQFNTFNNEDDIGRFLNGKASQELKFEIFGGEVENLHKKFIILKIYESKKAYPVICTQDYPTKDNKCRLNKGYLYIRSISNPIESRSILSAEEWDELILRLLTRKEEIIYKDLNAICSNLKTKKKQPIITKKKSKLSSSKYEAVLKRDKL